MTKPIPYDDDDAPEQDERDMRKIAVYDDEALKMMQGWTGGQDDPLYAISSTGGWNYAWVFEDAIVNIDRDLRSVKKLGRNKFQLGKGTFTKAEIDELSYIRDALQMALDDPESELVDERVGEARESHRVADFNTVDDLIAHARDELGATHVLFVDEEIHLYFPRRDGTYEKAEVWQKGGYWHAQGPGARTIVQKIPAEAQPIGGGRGRRTAETPMVESKGFETRNPKTPGWYVLYKDGTFQGPHPDGERGAKYLANLLSRPELPVKVVYVSGPGGTAREARHVRDYEAVDNRGRRLAGPFKSYSDAKSAAGTGGHVKYVRPGAHEARRRPKAKRSARRKR